MSGEETATAPAAAPGCVRLRVPVTVRISPRAGGELPVGKVRAAVADAVAAACSRLPLAALGLAHRDVAAVAPAVRVAAGSSDAPQSLLDAASGGASDGAARAGFISRPAAVRGGTRVEDAVSEPFDPSRVRHHPTGLTYIVPFFDGGETEVPLREAEGSRTVPWLPAAGEVVSVAQAIDIAWRWHVYRHGGWAVDRELPGYNGLIRTPRGTFRCFLFLYDISTLSRDGAPIPGRFSYVLDIDLGTYSSIIGAFRSRPEQYYISYWAGVRAGAWYYDRGGDSVPIVFAIQAVSPGTGVEGGGAGGGVDPRATGDSPPGGHGSGLKRGDTPGGGTESDRARLDVYQLPGAPTGERAGWPVAPPTAAERLAEEFLGRSRGLDACQPFYVEPLVSDLVDVRHLAGRMRALSAALGVPECGYLGTFTLNCARIIAAHARGVGTSSVSSSVRTQVTVRPDGSGNNGYVDLRPGATPDLDWLKRLAGLTREVGRLANDLVDTYGYSQNVGKVGLSESSLPYYGGWVGRFRRELNRALRYGYESIFAETCRLLLLQQLRSSAEGITGRQDPTNFIVAVEDLRSKLEILGESVLWPTVLLRAIQHADRVYTPSATVREVLSTAESWLFGEGPPVDLPPPIKSTPKRILEIVGDSRIERRGGERVAVHGGRTWTADELRQTINQRRALLNTTDPLFLQIPDLQGVYAGNEADPAFLLRYLKNLLNEMQRANKKMTEKASDPDDGAYFALEASQYIKREGGRDWRGLRYTLQGIHALADEQIAPHAREDWLYVEGINAAIDHKADLDDLLSFVSSIGIIVLGLLCAPLGAVAAAAITGIASIGFAVHDVLEAQRQTDLYRALEDPELFQHWQDVQLAQLMAAVSVAFSIFDLWAVGKAAHALTSGALATLRVAEKQGAKVAFRLAAAEVRERVLKNMTEEVLRSALRQAVHEAVVMAVLNELLPHIIAPVLVPWIRHQAQEHGTSAEVDAALGPLATGGGTQ